MHPVHASSQKGDTTIQFTMISTSCPKFIDTVDFL